MEKLKSTLVDAIKSEVEELTNYLDESWVENFDIADAMNLVDSKHEILKNFVENYSPAYYDNDTLSAQALIKKYGKDTIFKALIENSSTRDSGYYTQSNELFSIQIGEYEHQIDVECTSTLAALIEEATDEELEAAEVERESFTVLGHPCDRLILELDAAAFIDYLDDLDAPMTPPAGPQRPQLTLIYSAPMSTYEYLRRRVLKNAAKERALKDARRRQAR